MAIDSPIRFTEYGRVGVGMVGHSHSPPRLGRCRLHGWMDVHCARDRRFTGAENGRGSLIMSEDEATPLEDFRLWASQNPGHTDYDKAKNFLSDLLKISHAKAEVQLAKWKRDEEIEIIKTYKTSRRQRRVFLKPLDDLSESDIREAWGGSSSVEVKLDDLCRNVHDRTGYTTEEVREFIKELDSGVITGEHFRWSQNEEDSS